MKFFKKINITCKYLFIFIVIPTIFTFILCLVTITLYRESLKEIYGLESRLYSKYIRTRSKEKADFLAEISYKYFKDRKAEQLELLGDYIISNPEIKYVAVMDINNELIFSRGKMEMDENMEVLPRIIRDDEGNYCGAILLHVTKNRINLLIKKEKEMINHVINQILVILILVFIVCNIGLVTTGSLLLNDTLLNPLRTLVKATRSVTTGNLDARLDNVPEDEIGELGNAFNNMAEALQKREQELRESRDFLHQVFRSASDYGIVTTDLDRSIILYSQGAENVLGWTDKEILGNTIDRIFKDFDKDELSRIIEKLKAGKRGFDGETQLIRKDGSVFPAHLSIYPVRGGSGAVESFLTLFQDISPRKELEEKLSESEYNYRTLVESSYSMVYMIQDGVFRYVNKALSREFGYAVEEVIGMTALELVAPQHKELVKKNISKRIDGETEAVLYDFLALRKDGSTFNMEVNGVKVIYHGKPAIQGTGINITERKEYEKQILEANLKMQSVLDSITDYAIVSTDKKGVIEIFNRGAENLFGYSSDEVVSKENPSILMKGPDGESKGFENFLKTNDPSKPIEEEIVFIRKNKTTFPGILSISCRYDTGNNQIGLQGIIKDITRQKEIQEQLKNYSQNLEKLVEERTLELKKAQEELVQKEKLAVLGQLTGTVSHELRNPLAVMRSSIYYLKGRLPEEDDKISKHLERIERQIVICDNIIGELLEYTRAWIPRVSETSINSLISFTLSELSIPENINLEKQFDRSIPIIEADPGKIQQVIINVVQNAIQSMEKGGTLKIETINSGDSIIINVIDQGAGISEENLNRIFEPLFTTKARGVGLGLSIVKKIVEAHKGNISVKSKSQEGTLLRIELPKVTNLSDDSA